MEEAGAHGALLGVQAMSARTMPTAISEPTMMNIWFLKTRAPLISPPCSTL